MKTEGPPELRLSRFGRWSLIINRLSLLWLLAALVLGLWPVPDKYPWSLGFVALAAFLITAGVKGWNDDVISIFVIFAILTGLVVWTFAAWDLPDWAVLACMASIVIPVLWLGTALRAAGAASNPYYEEDR